HEVDRAGAEHLVGDVHVAAAGVPGFRDLHSESLRRRGYPARVSAVPYRATFVRLLGFLRPYRVGLVVSIVLAVGSQAAQIALVWITGRDVIDKALIHRDTHRLWVS